MSALHLAGSLQAVAVPGRRVTRRREDVSVPGNQRRPVAEATMQNAVYVTQNPTVRLDHTSRLAGVSALFFRSCRFWSCRFCRHFLACCIEPALWSHVLVAYSRSQLIFVIPYVRTQAAPKPMSKKKAKAKAKALAKQKAEQRPTTVWNDVYDASQAATSGDSELPMYVALCLAGMYALMFIAAPQKRERERKISFPF